MRLVGTDVLCRDHGVERDRKAALGEGDEVSVAVREQRKPPALVAAGSQRGSDVRKDGPVRNGCDQSRGVVIDKGQRQPGGGTPQALCEDLTIPAERLLRLDLRLSPVVRTE